jgi:hypothetical protein
MKQSTLLLLLFFCLVLPVGGQNLVSNGSFEDMVACPYGLGQIFFAEGWDSSRESPDYYNSCANLTDPYSGTPSNSFGYQEPASGDGYVGLICYNSAIFSREVIVHSLSEPLSVGQEYFVSFKVNSADYPLTVLYGVNNLGIKFSTDMQSNVSIDNSPMFYSDNVISDTLNWITISGTFVADSAYQHLMIGNFFDDVNTTVVDNGGSGVYAYYYIDDVCLSTDSLFCANSPTGVEENGFSNQFTFYPNPASDQIIIKRSSNTPYDLEVYNAVGQHLYSQQNITSGSFQLDISTYNSGLLFIKTISPKNQLIHKLIKQ